MTKEKQYTSDDIQVLSDHEHVRLRTQIYLGNTKKTSYTVPLFIGNKVSLTDLEFTPAVYKAVGEIIDNCIDEFQQTNNKTPMIKIDANPFLGTYMIADNGRGVPIDKHASGPYTPEVVFGQLRSGRNFGDDNEAGVIGQNGVGSACVNYCSTEFTVTINRDGKKYRQVFSDGGTKRSKPSIRKAGNTTGTQIEFQLDNQVFEDTSLPNELTENKAIELALTNPGITVEYNRKKYKFRKGFDDIVKKISSHYFKFEEDGMEFFVIFDLHDGIDEKIFTWVNSSLLFDGGICNTQFLNAFYDKAIKHLTPQAKKNKCEVTKNDIRKNLFVIGNVRVANPEYDSQSKTRLTGPNLRKEMSTVVDNQWNSFSRKNKEWLGTVLERAMDRHHSQANKKAVNDHKKNLKKKVPGLIDATSKNRFETMLLVTEGLSAASEIVQVRDPKIHGSYPLTGKINNVFGTTVAQLLKMGKVTDLITAIGLIPGQKASRGLLNYGKVIIATDSDYDGSDIMTLLINLWFEFWPELYDPEYEPFIYRLVAPNVCAVKGKKRVHFATRNEYEKVKSKYKGWEINYYKGLGSMDSSDWEMILSGETDTMVPFINDGNMKETLKLLFSDDADARKEWLQNEES